MKKNIRQIFAAVLAVVMTFSLTACNTDTEETITGNNTGMEQDDDTQNPTITESPDSKDTDTDAFKGGAVSTNPSDQVASRMIFDGKNLTIQRSLKDHEESMGADGTWTILCYLCGTDLESENGAATDDINEMLAASSSDNINFIIEAGGTSKWMNDEIPDGELTRMQIKDGELEILGTANASMGSSATLQSFLEWGVENYPAANMGLIFWNHGSGSINGVCFDELYDSDSLSLTEIDEALSGVYDKMSEKFEFIGFDACLMSTLETANVLVPHAKYMIASEETESGIGWEYTSILNYLSENSDADGAELGKVICDSFYAGNEAEDLESMATLAVIDLSKIDSIIDEFNTAAADIYDALEDTDKLAEFCRNAMKAENYGGNNDNEGYTDMADLGDIMDECSSVIGNTDQVIKAIKDAVVYQVRGSQRANGYGLSIFFPYAYSSEYIDILKDISVSPYYMAFCDKFSYVCANGDNVAGYDDAMWLSDEGYWGEDYDESAFDGESDYSYWDNESESYYVEDKNEVGNLVFDQLPVLDHNGNFGFTVTEDSLDYIESVRCCISQWMDEDEVIIGTDNEVNGDWISGRFYDNFDGLWFSLPDGQNLCTYLIEEGDDYDIYSSPVTLNGEDTFLRIVWNYKDNEVTIAGTWSGIDEDTGVSARVESGLKPGDVMIPLYEAFDGDGNPISYEGEEYTYEGDSNIYYEQLDEGVYGYSFKIIDIYGNTYDTDYVNFTVDEDGEVYYDED